jgi:localization factor PodJL
MGEFLLYGFGRPANKRDARIYIERAADMWNADSQFLMGEIFAKGMIGPVNRTEAGKWFFVAASHSSNHNSQAATYLAALTDQELTSARRMADLWISAHPKAPFVDYSALIERVR